MKAENETAPAATGAAQEREVTIESMGRTERTVNAFAYPLVDPEFVALLPPLTRDQKGGLEKLIVAAKEITSPLIVWAEERLLIDGHHRREIAMRLGMDFRTKEMSFPSREAVIEWMFANQRDHRNLTPGQLALVMGRHYNRTKKDPSERMLGNDFRKRGAQNERQESDATDVKLSKQYGTSPATVRRNAQFAAAVETLRAIDPDIEAKVVTGKGPTRKAVIAAAGKVDSDPTGAVAMLVGTVKPEPRRRYPEGEETLAERKGFKNLPNRALADKVAASLLALETHLEFLETVNPERLNGERESLTERLCKAARLLNRTRTAWTGEKK